MRAWCLCVGLILIHSFTHLWSTYCVLSIARWRVNAVNRIDRPLLSWSFLLSQWRRQSIYKQLDRVKVFRKSPQPCTGGWAVRHGSFELKRQTCKDFWGEHSQGRKELVQRP